MTYMGRWVAGPLVLLAITAAAAPIPDFAAVVEGLACETLGAKVFHPTGDTLSATPIYLGTTPDTPPLQATCENAVGWVCPWMRH